jgi:hypothetical protein
LSGQNEIGERKYQNLNAEFIKRWILRKGEDALVEKNEKELAFLSRQDSHILCQPNLGWDDSSVMEVITQAELP